MITKPPLAANRHGRPHAQVHFPPLTAKEALLLSNLLDRAIAALWRAHGRAMSDVLAGINPDEDLPDPPADPVAHPNPDPDLDDIF